LTMVESVDDILESLGPLFKPVKDQMAGEIRHPNEFQLNEIERRVLQQIGTAATPLEQIIESSELDPHQVLVAINVLERRRLIVKTANEKFARV